MPAISIFDPQDANINVSQVAVEPLSKPGDGNLRVSQIVIEVLKLPSPAGSLRVSQSVIELIKSPLVVSAAPGQEIYEA